MKRARVLVVDDKENFLALFRRVMPPDLELACALDGVRALALFDERPFDVVVTDVRMPGMDGAALLREMKRRSPATEVILMTAYGSIPAAVDAMRLGAFDYLTKPFDPADAVLLIERALEHAMERATALSPGPLIDADALPEDANASIAPTSVPPAMLANLSYRDVVAISRDQTSREYLIAILQAVGGNVTQAAERAGIERESLHRLMRKHGIRAEDFRAR
ncbi:MAG TPA: response regulator [Polyangiaceae bacterium]|nr:response regulator [Polyangiaceae bacterium]